MRAVLFLGFMVLLAGCTQPFGPQDGTSGPSGANTVDARGLLVQDVRLNEQEIAQGETTQMFVTFSNTNPKDVSNVQFSFDNLGGLDVSEGSGLPAFCSDIRGSGGTIAAAANGQPTTRTCVWDLTASDVSMIGSSTSIPVSFSVEYDGELTMTESSLQFVFGDERDTVMDNSFSNSEISLQTTHPGQLDWGDQELSLDLTTRNTGTGQIVSGEDARRVTYELDGSLMEDAGFTKKPVEDGSGTTCDAGVFLQGERSVESTCVLQGAVSEQPAPVSYTLTVDVSYRYQKYGSLQLTVTDE